MKNESKNKKIDKSMYFYGAVFLIILIFAVSNKIFNKESVNKENSNNNNNNLSETMEKTDISNLLDGLKDNNFDLNLYITADTDILNLVIRRENINRELVSKTYLGETLNYYRNNYDIYILTQGNYELASNVKFYNDYDSTFVNIENIISLINNSYNNLDLKEENYDIKRYKTDISKVLEIYNKYNAKNITKTSSGDIIIDVNYSGDNIVGLKLDLTTLYTNLEYKYKNVTYNFSIANVGTVNIDSFTNIILKEE